MKQATKKTSLAFKILLGVTIATFVLFVVMLFIFGLLASKVNDPDINPGLGTTLKYHFTGFKGLFSFSFHNASNIIYFSLSGLLYFFIFITALYIAAAVLVIVKKKGLIVIPGMVASILVIFVFLMAATGTPKYWYIINQRGLFENDNTLIGPTFGVLLFSVFYVLSAYILYFYSLFLAMKNAPAPAVEKSAEEKAEEPAEKEEEKPAEEEAPLEEEKPINYDEPVIFEEVDSSLFEKQEEQPKQEAKQDVNSDDIRAIIREAVRDIVRDEIARNNANNSSTGQGGQSPLIVQYFNTIPAETQAYKPEPVSAPKAEAKKEEKVVVKPAPKVEEPVDKKPIVRIPFVERMLSADKEMQDNYNELKNEIMSYGVNSRVSNSGDTFRLHRKTYVKITIAGLSLKLYFALNPDDYKDSTLPVQNAGHKGIYEEIPLVFKVKSGLSMRRCKQLIQDVFDKNGFEQGEIANINWVDELKNAPSSDDED